MNFVNHLKEEQALYRSYVVRLTRPDASLAWRYSVSNILTGETHAFANLTGLVNFLQSEEEPGPALESNTSSDSASGASNLTI